MSAVKAIQTRHLTLESPSARARFPRAEFGVFEAKPVPRSVRGGLVLIQEIFGVNHHIRTVAERWAELGFHVWAPAVFDHLERGVELPYDAGGISQGRALMEKLAWDQPLDDIQITAHELKRELDRQTPGAPNHVAAMGFCWGGSLAFLTATRQASTSPIVAAVGYYGRHIHQFRNERPKIPLLLHYGEKDPSIPMEQIKDVKSARPELPIHTYEAGHGFNCDERLDYHAYSARLAQERTLEFFAANGL